ncbi:hypothetical protein H2198_002645 [Neophaeococcomyces mojaviensis]|uniref:Uncharacterized protein n=1 Tax=Neophaeococcomyces mojaviensis TaxID=3383035 RepID=A0ACC3ADP9_9EURO|nr:hypothetical protein H2198_002645 [Knufia sp. JES_112]
MSFTLMRYKDGKPAPIKLSIWDAFKGVPPPKSRPHTCSSCNSFHRPSAKHDAGIKAQPEAEAGKPKDEEKKDVEEEKALDKPADGDDSGFTAEEDAKVLKLKVEGKTWAQIAQELGGGRVKHDITRRHKQLTSVSKGEEREEKGGEKDGGKADNDDKEEENEKEKTPAKMSKKEKKAAKAEKDREEGLKRKEEMVKKKETEEMKAAVEAKEPPAEPEPAKPPTDDKPSQSATTDAKPSDIRNDKQKWIAAASKHFDRTGQRITPEQARKMVERKST